MISLKSESKVDKFGQVFFQVSYKDGDKLIEKDVSLADYKRIINESVEELTTWVEVPKIPVEVCKAWISSKGEEDGYKVLLHVKEQMWPFSYAGKIMRLAFPGLVFCLVVKKGIIIEKKVFAVKDDVLNPDSRLFYYPFGNVNEQGEICMGNILVNVPTIKDSVKFIESFMEGRTNSDLARMKNAFGYSQAELIKRVEEKTSYPKELLLPNNKKLINLF